MKWLIHSLIVLSLLIMIPITTSADSTNVSEQCDYTPVEGEDPSYQVINCLLTETALEHDVPPEIVKAIAEVESSGWDHFDANGNAIVSEDGGIGLMQITNQDNYDDDQLKSSIPYNIEAGVKILDQMFNRSDLPKINDKHRDLLEHWYFAVMAYNGTKPVNSPIVQSSGEQNEEAYQEEVFQEIKDHSLVDLSLPTFTASDFDYDPDSSENITFETMSYQTDSPATKSKHLFAEDTPITSTTSSLSVREEPTTNSEEITHLNANDSATITGQFVYDQNPTNPTNPNHFTWYPIELENGQQGYVAGGYLKHHYKDVPNDSYATEPIYYLTKRGYLKGVGNSEFGYNQDLTRPQAAILLNRVNHISLNNRPSVDFTDVPSDYTYYNHIAASVDEGYFKGNTEGEFGIDDSLSRAAMATVLNRVYDIPEATEDHPFTDLPEEKWYSQAAHNLYEAGITKGTGDGKFKPNGNVTRQQFATFLTRTIK